jgi:GWxTD domain-containing protein
MSTQITFRISILLALLVVVPSSLAQPSPQKKSSADPQNKPRKVRPEPAKAFKVWIDEVEPIITPEERNAWNKLQTDEEREQFIAIFWNHRDPDPDTEENEYREGYYERVEYVNEHFSSGIPGVKTDRGRIYLKFGKPDEVESHPAGGTYEREASEGGGSTSTYPFERWFYRNVPGLSGAEIEFVDPTGTGEYRIAQNPFQKEVFLSVPGAAPTLDGVNQADRLAAANGIGNPFSHRAQDSEFEWLDRIRLMRDTPPPVNFDSRIDRTGKPVVEDNFLTSAVQISYFKQSDDRVIVAFTVQTDNKDLVFRDVGGIQTARLNIYGRITTVADRPVGFFEDAVTTTATTTELVDAKERRSAYQKAVTLLPGRYRVDLFVRDINSGAESRTHVGFEVPKFGANLASSSLILASLLDQVSDIPASRQFVIGDKKVIPNLTATYHRGAPVGIYMQIYNAGIDQTTLRPSVDVEYALLKDGREVGTQVEDWRGTSTAGERLTLARLIDSHGLAAGDYAVEVRAHDRVSGQSLVQTAKFAIVK